MFVALPLKSTPFRVILATILVLLLAVVAASACLVVNVFLASPITGWDVAGTIGIGGVGIAAAYLFYLFARSIPEYF